ncbi:exported hypothetical protein [Candidatus Zixiibacteriota bacterium]|nr:exported hypothetical protein [candidate division Zixibacteria bacterium]
MRKSTFVSVVFLLILIPALSVFANEFDVTGLQFSGSGWGNRTAQFSISNLSPDYKWVVAQINVAFAGPTDGPVRTFRQSFFMDPSASLKESLPFIIPGNYGKGIINIKLYDVIDTLDELFESQVFFARIDTLNFSVPSAVKNILDAGLNAPIFADRSEMFDNQFHRLLVYLIAEGKTAAEIARMTSADTAFVNQAISLLIQRNFLAGNAGKIRPAFAVIDPATLKRLKPDIDRAIDDLTTRLAAAMPAYDSLMARLVKENKLTSDPNNIMDGGSIVHHKFPTVLALFLWDRLGRNFVNDGTPFNIFNLSDPCDADMGKFMSLVAAGGQFVGNSFYYVFSENDGYRFYCGVDNPDVVCTALSRPMTGLRIYYQWEFPQKYAPDFYNYNPDKIEPFLSLLDMKVSPPALKLRDELVDAFAGDKIYELPGARYWAWNLIVSSVINRLEKEKVLSREGSGVYLLNKVTD